MRLPTLAIHLSLALVLVVGPDLMAAEAEPSLIVAAKSGDPAVVEGLLKSGADVDGRQVDGTTALHWAVRHDHVDVATLLLHGGADANAVNRYGVTSLSLAAGNGSAAMLDLLLRHGADVRKADAAMLDGQTLLMLAARTGRVAALRLLLAQGVDVNAVEPRTGTTAVIWAAVHDRGDAVQLLSEAAADINVRSKRTSYPHTPPAVIGDDVEPGVSYVGQTVLPKGAWTPLMYAAREGGTGAIRALAGAGADLDAMDPDGTSALILAIINGHAEAAAALIAAGADVNLGDSAGMTPLYAAVDMHTLASTFGRPNLSPRVVSAMRDTIDALLAAGADVNARLVSRVLKRVYNPGDPRLGEGATPFMRAARGADVEVMRLLLAAGADPLLTQKNGNSPILLAAGLGSERQVDNPLRGGIDEAMAAIELCLERGVDVNAVSASGESAMHAASGSPELLRFLAQRGARLDFRNKQGRTPLEAAMNAREPNAASIATLKELVGAAPTRVNTLP